MIRNGIREIYSKCTDEINESGEFHCKELSAGIFLLQIEPGITPSAIPWARQCSSTPRAFYYPASVDFDKATLITIAPHQAAWVDVQVPSLASYDLHADVPDAPATAKIGIFSYAGPLTIPAGLPAHYDGALGTFNIECAPVGEYVATAEWNDKGRLRHLSGNLVVSNSSKTIIQWSEDIQAVISGQLINSNEDVAQILLYSYDNLHPATLANVHEGAFQFPTVPSGKYWLALPVHQHQFIKAISIGTKETDGSSITVPPLAKPIQIEVHLQKPAAEIDGDIEKQAGIGPHLQVIAEDELSGETYSTVADNQQKFVLTGLRPGTYRLFAFPTVNAIAYRDPIERAQYRNDATEVTIDTDTSSGIVHLTPISLREPLAP